MNEQEKEICNHLVTINMLLKLAILIVVVGIGVIVYKGFTRLQNEIFGIKIVLADVGGYIKDSK